MTNMRLTKSSLVAGVPAPAARDLVRQARRVELRTVHAEGVLAQTGVDKPAEALKQLVEDGYLHHGQDGQETATTAMAGNAPAMASFARPITRATAERLVTGLLERAAQYNRDRSKPRFVRNHDALSFFDSEVISLFRRFASLGRMYGPC